MVINKLLNRHLLPIFRDSPTPETDVLKCLHLLEVIPAEWLGEARNGVPQLLRVFENRMKLFAEQSASRNLDK